MRTDDIQGAMPRAYGNNVPQGMMAGAPTGMPKVRNQSEIFEHLKNSNQI